MSGKSQGFFLFSQGNLETIWKMREQSTGKIHSQHKGKNCTFMKDNPCTEIFIYPYLFGYKTGFPLYRMTTNNIVEVATSIKQATCV